MEFVRKFCPTVTFIINNKQRRIVNIWVNLSYVFKIFSVGKVEENPLTLVTITPSGTINKIRT